MSLTENDVRRLINEEIYKTTTDATGNFSNFTLQEKVAYSIKLSLNRITTDNFASGKEWYTEPELFTPILKNRIYREIIPRYINIRSDYYIVVNHNNKKYITSFTPRDIMETFGGFNLQTVLTSNFVLPPSNSDITNTKYENSRVPLSSDFDEKGLLNKLPRTAWASFVYWKAYLTGRKANVINDTVPTNISSTGTYPSLTLESSIMTINESGTADGNKRYDNFKTNEYIQQKFNEYNSLQLISISNVPEIIDQSEDNDDILKSIHPFLAINMGVPTYSTWSGAPSLGATDNIAFYNPILYKSLSEVYGYSARNAGDGYYMISSENSPMNITPDIGVMTYSADTGFILFFGIVDVLSGTKISVIRPPIITSFKYTGETYDDGIIPQGSILPTIAKENDMFVNTTDKKIYRYTGIEWISVGGNDIFKEIGETKGYSDRSIAIHKTDVSNNYSLDVSGNVIIRGDVNLSQNTTILGNLTVTGNFNASQSIVETTQQVTITDKYLKLNEAALQKVYTEPEESGLLISRTREQNPLDPSESIYSEPFKIVFKDDRTDLQDDYVEVGISGELQRVATINARKMTTDNSNNYGAVPFWDSTIGSLNVNSQISISNEILTITRNVQITGKLLDADGDEYTAGASIVKADIDTTANELLKNKQTTGDLYFNTDTQLFKMHYSSLDSWVNTELGRIGSQPPPVMNLQYRQTTGYIELEWENPIQIATAMTSDLVYNKEHSPAAIKHPVTDQNIIYFPIVNRMCVRLEDMNGNYISYPMYQSNNAKVDSSFSQIIEGGNVIYRKGDKVAGQLDSSANAYIPDDGTSGTINRNLIMNMPNKLRIYKTVPNTYGVDKGATDDVASTDLSFTIMPFLTSVLSVPAEEYKVSLWLENNSLQSVNILSVDVSYEVAGAPAKPNLVEVEFFSTAKTNFVNGRNPLVTCKLIVEDPSFVAGTNNENDAIVNFNEVIFDWSLDNENWTPFKKMIYQNENVVNENGIQSINRPVDTLNSVLGRTQYTFFFDLSGDYMEDIFNTDLFTRDISNILYVGVRYKNTSNSNIGARGIYELLFDTPTESQLADLSFVSIVSANNTLCQIKIQDPLEILETMDTDKLDITGIRFEWNIGGDWYPFVKLKEGNNTRTLDPSGVHIFTETMLEERKERTYTFETTTEYMGTNVDMLINTGSHDLKYRVSYRNSAKVVFSDISNSNILRFEPPSQTREIVLSYNSSLNVNMSVCNITVVDPSFVIKYYDDEIGSVNELLKYTGTNFEWSLNGTDWSGFSKIEDDTVITLSDTDYTKGIYDISRTIIDTPRTYTFDISNHYITRIRENVYNSQTLPQPLYVRSAFRNSTKREFGDDLSSNVLYFDKPSIPRNISIDYHSTTADGLTRCIVEVIDPSFVLNYYDGTTEEKTPITDIQFSRIRFQWKIGEVWNDFNNIDDGTKQPLIDSARVDLKTLQNNARQFFFDISDSYMNDTPSTILASPTQLQLRVAYQNTTVAEFSDDLSSNLLQTNPPSAPVQVDICFNSTVGIDTKCDLRVIEPQEVIIGTNTIYNDKINIDGIKFEWSHNNIDWFNFKKMSNDDLIDGILNLNRKLLTEPTQYVFTVNTDYFDNVVNNILSGDEDTNLYVKVSFRNVTTKTFSQETTSTNPLIFSRTPASQTVDLSFSSTTITGITRCSIDILDPLSILSTNINEQTNINNLIKITGIQFQWKTNNETEWSNFNKIVTTDGVTEVEKTIINGIYDLSNETRIGDNLIDTTIRKYIFDISSSYMNNYDALTYDINTLQVRVFYRNSTKTNFGIEKSSNILDFTKPSEPELVDISFGNTINNGNTLLTINVKDPLNTVGDTDIYNNYVNLREIEFKWIDTSISTNEISFNNLNKGTNLGTFDTTLSRFKINRKRDDIIRTYTVEISSNFLDKIDTILDSNQLPKEINIICKYRNYLRKELSDKTNSNNLLFNIPSNPRNVNLSYILNTTDTSLTRCKINIDDPEYIHSSYNDNNLNSRLKYRGIKFEWFVNSNWTDINKIYESELKDTKTLDNGIYLYDTPTNTLKSREFWFDISNDYLSDDVSFVLDSSNIDIKIRVSYLSSIVNTFSNTQISNDISNNVPEEPFDVSLIYLDSAVGGDTICEVKIWDPLNIVKYQMLNEVIEITHIQYQWSINEIDWYNFNKITFGINDLTLIDGAYNIIPRLVKPITAAGLPDPDIYTFKINTDYMGNPTILGESNNPAMPPSEVSVLSQLLDISYQTLYVRSRYRNSTTHLYGDYKSSTVLNHNPIPKPEMVDICFNNTVNGYTQCVLKVIDPITAMNGFINSPLDISSIRFEWTYTGSEWYTFNKMYSSASSTTNILTNSEYRNQRTLTTTSTLYYFLVNNEDMGSEVNNIINTIDDTSLNIRVSYRNSAKTVFGNYEKGMPIIFSYPQEPKNINLLFNQTTDNGFTQCRIELEDPEYISKSDFTINNIIDITGIRFQWGISGETITWSDFKGILVGEPLTNITNFTNGLYDISRNSRLIDTTKRVYRFNLSNSYLNNYTSVDINYLRVKASYRNSLKSYTENFKESDSLAFIKPSAPEDVDISYETTGTTSSNTDTLLNIVVTDPEYVVGDNRDNNMRVKFDRIKFEWYNLATTSWDVFKNIIDSGYVKPLTNGEYDIRYDHISTPRSYQFGYSDLNGINSLLGFNGTLPVEIKTRVSYKNYIRPEFGNVTESNMLPVNVPSQPDKPVLTFDGVNGTNTKMKISVKDPAEVILGSITYNNIKFVNIKFEWSSDNSVWNSFTKIYIGSTEYSNGIYNVVIERSNTERVVYFDMTDAYLGSGNTDSIIGTNGTKIMYVRASYMNSVISKYGAVNTSDVLNFYTASNNQTVSVSILGPSTDDISNAKTIIQIAVKDPTASLFDGTTGVNNTSVKVKELEFKWGNNVINQAKVSNSPLNVSQFNSASYVSFTDGVYTPTSRSFDTNTRYYYVTLTSGDLNGFTSLTTSNNSIVVSVAYKNTALSQTFNSPIPSTALVINKPNKPLASLINLKMITGYKLEITLTKPSNDDIITSTGNTNTGVFIKEVEYIVERRLDGGNYTALTIQEVSYSATISATSSVYRFDIPQTETKGTTGYDLRVKMRLKNNIIDQWSDYNDVNDDIIEDTNDLFIRQITSENEITTSTLTNTTLTLIWNHPADKKRGVTKTDITIPNVEKYEVFLNSNTTPIKTLSQLSRTTDANNTTNINVNNLIQAGNNKIDISINQYNEFISTPSTITSSISYSLDNPGTPNITSNVSISNTENLNTMNISWNSVSTGYDKGGSVDYEITITADKSDTLSPYYKSLNINNTSFTTTTSSTSLSNITRNTTTLPLNRGDVIVYPDTKYTINVKAINNFNLSSTGTSTISKVSPIAPGGISLFTNTINLPSGYTFIKYTNKGFLKTDTTKTSVSIINASSLTSNHIAISMTRRMNNEKLTAYSNDVNYQDISNLQVRQVRIKNVANNNVVFRLGTSSSLFGTDKPIDIGIAHISSSKAIDMYSRTGYDIYNQGYWWMEDISYGIYFGNKTNLLYTTPIKLQFEVGYTTSTTPSTYDTNVNASAIILQDTSNSNAYAYFDNLTGNPTITKLDTRPYIREKTNTNKINGIPNITPITGKSYSYELTYKLENYSTYYELQKDISFTAIDIFGTLYSQTNIKTLTYDTSNGFVRGTNNWDISGLEITNTNIPIYPDVLRTDITFRINARSTFGIHSLSIPDSTTELSRFISDVSSVTHLESLLLASQATTVPTNILLQTGNGQLIEVPTDFTPEEFNHSTQTSVTAFHSGNVYSSYQTYNNRQLILYRGEFMSPSRFKTYIDYTVEGNRIKYGLPSIISPTDTNYSYAIFKFERKNNTVNNLTFKRFVLSLGSKNNITYTDIVNRDVVIFINTYQNITNASQEITYATNKGIRNKWMLYSPNANIGEPASATTTITVASPTQNKFVETGLGSNNVNAANSQTFDNGTGNLNTILNNTYYTQTGRIKNITGVYFTTTNLTNSNGSLIYYVAIGIRNDKNIYFEKIESFDIFTTNNGIPR